MNNYKLLGGFKDGTLQFQGNIKVGDFYVSYWTEKGGRIYYHFDFINKVKEYKPIVEKHKVTIPQKAGVAETNSVSIFSNVNLSHVAFWSAVGAFGGVAVGGFMYYRGSGGSDLNYLMVK